MSGNLGRLFGKGCFAVSLVLAVLFQPVVSAVATAVEGSPQGRGPYNPDNTLRWSGATGVPYDPKNPFAGVQMPGPIVARRGADRVVGLLVRGVTLGFGGAEVPPRDWGESLLEMGGASLDVAVVGVGWVLYRRRRRRVVHVGAIREVSVLQLSRSEAMGGAMTLVGLALVMYNLLSFEPSSSLTKTGAYYPELVKVGTLFGGLLVVSGIFLYRRKR